jgi:hypothetical protein
MACQKIFLSHSPYYLCATSLLDRDDNTPEKWAWFWVLSKKSFYFLFLPKKTKKPCGAKLRRAPKKPKENYSLGAAGCSPAGVSVVVVVVVAVVSSFVTSLAASSAA